MTKRRCLSFILLQLLLLFASQRRCRAVLGSEGYGSPQGGSRQTKPTCIPQCYCSGDSIECDSWSGDRVDFLRRTTTTLSIRNYPKKYFNTSIFDEIPNIQWLRLSPGSLEHFPDISKLSKLSFLDVSGNNIRNLPSKITNDVSNLVHLNISLNKLTTLSPAFFTSLKLLRILDLSINPISNSIADNILTSNLKLNYLDLSSINLKVVPSAILKMPNLYYLNLSSNNLKDISELQQPSLEILDISYNPIKALPALDLIQNLVKLYASYTNIANIGETVFRECSNMKIIDISASNLTKLDGRPLKNCRSLEELRFSGSLHLRIIEEGVLNGLDNLEKLFIDNCPVLHELEKGIMNNVSNLKELHLQNSGLEVLPTSMQNLINLTVLNLENMKLRCDCSAFWIPDWWSTLNHTLMVGVDQITCKDKDRTEEELKKHLQDLKCSNVEVISPKNEWILAPWGQSALLSCNTTGTPAPNIIWQTSQQELLIYSKTIKTEWIGRKIKEALSRARVTNDGKYQVLQSGKLLIKKLQREDIGRYKCFAYNELSNASAVTFLGLQDTQFRAFVQESILFGLLCAATFLFITLLINFIKYLMDRLGCQCCCCRNRLSPKAKQIRQLLESVETYKSAQLEKLRENYNSQVVYIKESCYQQMEKIRDSYSHQSKNLRDLRDYSTQQLSGARDQYVDQVNKARDYSLGQMNRVRENYVFQRQRIRKFSAHQLLKLRETYKYQQKTLNKLLETLPDFYIQNCRTGSCQRTDSFLFDELEGLDVYYKVDFLDNISTSDYYTPSSTLTRHPKGNQCHSSNPSTASGGTEYLESFPYISRQESTKSDQISKLESKLHGRSFSLAAPPTMIHRSEVLRGHKRSLSATHPSPQSFHPTPAALVEETITPPISPVLMETPPASIHTSTMTPLYTPQPSPMSESPKQNADTIIIIQDEIEDLPSIAKSPSDVYTVSEILSDSTDSINNKDVNTPNCDNTLPNENITQETGPDIALPNISYETSL